MLNELRKKTLWKQVILILICIIIFMLPILIKNNGILIYYGDSFEEFYQFYLGGWEKVHSQSISFFDWSIGLGGNTFGYSDMYLFSPYFWFTTLFSKAWMPYLFTILNVFKFILTFVFTNLWTSKITKNDSTKFVVSSIITFSGWVFFYNHYMNFLDAYLMFPLILFFVEEYLQNKRFKGLVISVFLLTIQSYYFAYIFMPFLFLYALFRFVIIHFEKINFKFVFFEAIKFFGLTMLGISLGAIVLLPSLYTIFGNNRLSEELNLFSTITLYDFFKIITSSFVPVFSRLDPNFFIDTQLIGNLGWGFGCSIFSLFLSTLLLPQLFMLIKKKQTWIILGFYLLLVVFMIFPASWKLLQGTIDTRWFYMFVFLNAYSIAYIFDNYLENDISFNSILKGIILVLSVVVICFLVSWKKHLNTSIELKQLLVVLVIEFICAGLYIFFFKTRHTKYLLIGLVIEIILSGSTHLYYNQPRDYSLFEPNLESACVIDSIVDYDSSFYRIIYDEDYYMSANEPFAKNYAGASFYYSIYNYEQEDFLNRYKSTWLMPMVSGRYLSLNQLSVKYWYTYHYKHEIPTGYTFLKSDCGFDIYENPYYLGLAYFMDKTINVVAIEELNYLEQDLVMQNYLITDFSDNFIFEEADNVEMTKIGTFSTNEVVEINFDHYLTAENLYFIPSDYNPQYVLRFYDDDALIFEKHYYQMGYLDLFFTGYPFVNRIEIEFIENKYSEFVVYEEKFSSSNYADWYEKRKQEELQNITVSKDKVTMLANSNKDQFVYTSIPFDKGWTLYVDGIKTDYFKANMGFIGFSVSKGTHNIELKYRSIWFDYGLAISVISLLFFVLLCYKETKQMQTKFK